MIRGRVLVRPAAFALPYTPRMSRKLDGMVVVITGASAGIGRALAEKLDQGGARLALAARRIDRLDELNRTLGGRHLCVRTDVSRQNECEALIRRTFDHFGRIDTLVCNAGYGLLRPVAEMSAEQVDQMFRTNVYGTTDCIRAAVPLMLKQPSRPGDAWRGQIVLVTSAVARRSLPYYGTYSATKAAQLSLAEALRVELKSSGIAVTSVHPIGTDTEFGEAARRAGSTNLAIQRSRGEVVQSASTVARKILRAIERPRAEVWPFRPSRWALSLATLAPSLVDRVLAKRVVPVEAE